MKNPRSIKLCTKQTLFLFTSKTTTVTAETTAIDKNINIFGIIVTNIHITDAKNCVKDELTSIIDNSCQINTCERWADQHYRQQLPDQHNHVKDELTSIIDNSCQINTILLSCCFAAIVSCTWLGKQWLSFSLFLVSYNTAVTRHHCSIHSLQINDRWLIDWVRLNVPPNKHQNPS